MLFLHHDLYIHHAAERQILPRLLDGRNIQLQRRLPQPETPEHPDPSSAEIPSTHVQSPPVFPRTCTQSRRVKSRTRTLGLGEDFGSYRQRPRLLLALLSCLFHHHSLSFPSLRVFFTKYMYHSSFQSSILLLFTGRSLCFCYFNSFRFLMQFVGIVQTFIISLPLHPPLWFLTVSFN